MAETYHIYDYKQLPPSRVATLVVGLKDNSRVKMAISGSKVGSDTLLLAGIADSLKLILWVMTRNGKKGPNRPKSILLRLLGLDKENNVEGFSSGEDFLRAKKEILKNLEKGAD